MKSKKLKENKGKMKEDKIKAKVLMIMLLHEYADYLSRTKGKDFSEKLQNQLEKDRELSDKAWLKKYKPLWLKMKNDIEFDKYLDERPLVECDDCGSANMECIGLGDFEKEFEIQMFKWKCHSCNEILETSINEEGKTHEEIKKLDEEADKEIKKAEELNKEAEKTIEESKKDVEKVKGLFE